MIDFLERQGLAVKHPLHVILDDGLDIPEVEVHMIPHREIRVPHRAPGVLEDGYTETDPWADFKYMVPTCADSPGARALLFYQGRANTYV